MRKNGILPRVRAPLLPFFCAKFLPGPAAFPAGDQSFAPCFPVRDPPYILVSLIHNISAVSITVIKVRPGKVAFGFCRQCRDILRRAVSGYIVESQRFRGQLRYQIIRSRAVSRICSVPFRKNAQRLPLISVFFHALDFLQTDSVDFRHLVVYEKNNEIPGRYLCLLHKRAHVFIYRNDIQIEALAPVVRDGGSLLCRPTEFRLLELDRLQLDLRIYISLFIDTDRIVRSASHPGILLHIRRELPKPYLIVSYPFHFMP